RHDPAPLGPRPHPADVLPQRHPAAADRRTWPRDGRNPGVSFREALKCLQKAWITSRLPGIARGGQVRRTTDQLRPLHKPRQNRLEYCSPTGAPRTSTMRPPRLYQPPDDPEVQEWWALTPAQRFAESSRLWATYLALGGSLEPEPDWQSPFYF